MDSLFGFLLVSAILGVAAWWAMRIHQSEQHVILDVASKQTDKDLKGLQAFGYGMMKNPFQERYGHKLIPQRREKTSPSSNNVIPLRRNT